MKNSPPFQNGDPELKFTPLVKLQELLQSSRKGPSLGPKPSKGLKYPKVGL